MSKSGDGYLDYLSAGENAHFFAETPRSGPMPSPASFLCVCRSAATTNVNLLEAAVQNISVKPNLVSMMRSLQAERKPFRFALWGGGP